MVTGTGLGCPPRPVRFSPTVGEKPGDNYIAVIRAYACVGTRTSTVPIRELRVAATQQNVRRAYVGLLVDRGIPGALKLTVSGESYSHHMSANRLPRTLLEATRYFADTQVCVDFVAGLRWPNGPECPACGGTEHYYLASRKVWKCKGKTCHKQFSVKVGTIFQDSPIPLDKWLVSMWLIVNAKNSISSHELGRSVGMNQKAAWFVLHRIRHAMRTGTFEKFDGQVETDETYVGGLAKNMKKADHDRKITTRGGATDKAMVVGTVQRGVDGKPSQVHAEVMLDTQWNSPQGHVRRTVEPGADVYTDKAAVYRSISSEYKHSVVDHSRGEYVRGQVSTNSIENFWSLLKRALHGTQVAVDEQHLFRYVDERVYAFNTRKLSDYDRFEGLVSRVAGIRLTWAELTA